MDSILKRYSVRQFLDKDVEDVLIDKILRAAMQAPSAGNQQPWEFYIIKDKETIEKLSKASIYAGCAKNAPVVIVPVTRRTGLKFPEYRYVDMGIMCENIMLACTDLGLGSVMLGIYPEEERISYVNDILDLPEDLEAFTLIPVGYPKKEEEVKLRYDSSRIHKEV